MMKKRKDFKALFNGYVEHFNSRDLHGGEDDLYIPNNRAMDWCLDNAPLIRLPDATLEQTYYFRWWTYRKHIKPTPDGMVVTEFLRDVPWAGKHNTIVAAAGHHISEGRWLRDTAFLDEYITFFYREGKPRLYSNWLEHAILGLCKTRGNAAIGLKLLDDMACNVSAWDNTNLHTSGLYWSSDDRDAGEFSVSGDGLRTPLNCYQHANKKAVASLMRLKGEHERAGKLEQSARDLRDKINGLLWDESKRFYKTIPLIKRENIIDDIPEIRDVRELWGYLPWLFNVAPEGRADAFAQMNDPDGFMATHGLTTAERRNPGFGVFYSGGELNEWLINRGDAPIGDKGHECLWNGPIWPFATCMALSALANLLTSGEHQLSVSKSDYIRLLTQYAHSHTLQTERGSIPWLDENINPDTGDWISRKRLSKWENGGWSDEKGGYERGKDYNHSTFCDLIINGLFGIKPELRKIRIAPLLPYEWQYATLENIKIHGHDLAVCYSNPRMGGDGYSIYVDSECVFKSDFPKEVIL